MTRCLDTAGASAASAVVGGGRRVAVVGGGPMGTAAALELAAAGCRVTLMEAGRTLGGLSGGEDFGRFTWDRFYHCVLPSDVDLLAFLDRLGLGDEVRWRTTSTGVRIDGRTYPLDGGLDYLRFSALSVPERARLAWTIIRCGLVRDPLGLEDVTAEEWFTRVGGQRAYERIWRPLLRAKFGDAADRVSPVFLAAKIKRMLTARRDPSGSEKLGYVRGGYARVWARALEVLRAEGVEVRFSTPVDSIESSGDGRGAVVLTEAGAEHFDLVVRTDPPAGRSAVEYLGLVCLVLTLEEDRFPQYVLNIADEGFPFTGVIGMSDLVDVEETGGLRLAYVPKYLSPADPLFDASDEEVYRSFMDGLRRINPRFSERDIESWRVNRAAVVQPVQGRCYSRTVPEGGHGPVIELNNAQLLDTDLNNSRVIGHAVQSVRSLKTTGVLA